MNLQLDPFFGGSVVLFPIRPVLLCDSGDEWI